MTLRFGEVVLVRIQFHQVAGAKVRPALVLLSTGDDDFVAAPITSQARHSEYNLAIEDWQAPGLNVPSYVRVHKLTVLAKADIVRNLSDLSEKDRESLTQLLCRAFSQSGPFPIEHAKRLARPRNFAISRSPGNAGPFAVGLSRVLCKRFSVLNRLSACSRR